MVRSVEINKDKIYSSGEIIAILKADGWLLDKAEGSHHQFKHPNKPGKVTVKHPHKDVPGPTFKSIMKQAGLWRPHSRGEDPHG
jgi:Predicted periplasmic or secreted lipoprotein